MDLKKCPSCGTGNVIETSLKDHWFNKLECDDDCGWWDIEYKRSEYRTY
jgi:hypothetical protein